MKSKWIDHNGQRVAFVDLSGFERDFAAVKAEIDAINKAIRQEPRHSVLCLVDFRNTVATREVVDYMKNMATLSDDHVVKTAVLGITGVRKILHDVIVRLTKQSLRAFNDVESAKAWLVED